MSFNLILTLVLFISSFFCSGLEVAPKPIFSKGDECLQNLSKITGYAIHFEPIKGKVIIFPSRKPGSFDLSTNLEIYTSEGKVRVTGRNSCITDKSESIYTVLAQAIKDVELNVAQEKSLSSCLETKNNRFAPIRSAVSLIYKKREEWENRVDVLSIEK